MPRRPEREAGAGLARPGARPTPERAPSQGFTLLEVLVALIIFALTFGVLAQIFQSGFRQSASAEATATAVLLARSQLARVGGDLPVTTGEASGETGDGFRWHTGIRPAEIEPQAEDLALFLVEVTVAWGPPERERAITLSSLRLGALEPP